MIRYRGLLPIFAALSMVLTGCESRVTQENYDLIENGMTLAEVESILGGPGENVTPAGRSISSAGIMTGEESADHIYSWKSGQAEITVTVRDGKVVRKGKAGL